MSTVTTINAETTMVHDAVSGAIQRSDTATAGANCESAGPQKSTSASLWILVEWETPFLGDQDPYAVISSSEIIIPFDSDGSTRLYTGKLIQANPVKRQRVYESDEHPLSPPMESSLGISRSTGRAVSPPVRTITPRAFQSRTEYRPMTFDQQTQTIGSGASFSQGCSNEAQIERIISCLEEIMVEQRSYRMECEFNRKLLLELNEKINAYKEHFDKGVVIAVGTDEMSEGEAPIEQKVSMQASQNEAERLASNNNEINRKCEMRKITRGSTATICNNRSPMSNNEEPVETANLPIVFIDDCSMPVTITNLSAPPLSADSGPSKMEENIESSTDASSDRGTIQEMIDSDWNDERSSPSVGNRSTAEDTSIDDRSSCTRSIPESVLNKINWSNYKAATRKLLMNVFTREELATHSLTGRPSPAFRNEHQKPVKHPLDPTVVASVIKLVSTRCKVEESLVRSAITTKLADENKMYRMRVSQNPSQMQKKSTGRTNKENVKQESN
uniref:BEN domain-containing protein n=1 Tax=Anopheles albimanus TaxID=7167 RepID=A0A182F2G3_ANOAL